jgi:Uncharacterized conserved protein
MSRHFEFTENNSSKFWEIELSGNSFTTWWGKIGTDGMSKTKEFSSDAEAKLEYDKLVAEKVKKGYVETGVVASKPAPVASSPTAPVASSPKPAVASSPKATPVATTSSPAPVATASSVAPANPIAGLKSFVEKALNLKSAGAGGVAVLSTVDLKKMLKELPGQIEAASPRYWDNPFYDDAHLDVLKLAALQPLVQQAPEQQASFLFEILKELKSFGLRHVSLTMALEQVVTRLMKRNLPFTDDQLMDLVEAMFQDYPSKYLTGNSVLSTVEKSAESNGVSEGLEKKLKKLRAQILKGGPFSYQGPDAAERFIELT